MTPATVAGVHRFKAKWSREKIIERILRWNELYGEPPHSADWSPASARWSAQEWRMERYRAGDPDTGEPWPSLNAAKKPFGGLKAAVEAAGLVPNRPGPRRRRRKGTARPDVEQRAPSSPRRVEDELDAARVRVADAERRLERAHRRIEREVERADRVEARLGDARYRATRANERARRAKATKERARARNADVRARAESDDRVLAAEDAVRDADARVAAAEAQTQAALREADSADERVAEAQLDAARAVRRADESEAEMRRLASLVTGEARQLTKAELDELRRGPAGPGPLGEALKALAKARKHNDRPALAAALTSVARTAIGWRDRL